MDYSPKKIIRLLEENGFVLKRSKGSHFIYYNPVTKTTVPVPVHSKDLKKGTFFGILREAGIDKTSLN